MTPALTTRASATAATSLSSLLAVTVWALVAASSARGPAFAADAFHPEQLLMSERELAVFERLDHSEARARFIDRMWAQRDPELAGTWRQRLPLAEKEFGDLESDRARYFLLAGPPLYRLTEICPPPVAAHEIWHYGEGGGDGVAFVAGEGGELALWQPDDWARLLPGRSGRFGARVLESLCERGGELAAALASAGARGPPAPPAVDSAWLDRYLAETTLLPDQAGALDVALRLAFPARLGGRTATTLVFELATDDATPPATGGILVVGEFLDGDRLVDEFRIRFEDLRGEAARSRQLIARRHLPPGSYRAAFKVHDLDGNRCARIETEVEVPRVEERAKIDLGSRASLFKLLPPPDGFLVGNHRFETVSAGAGVAGVTFFLDGQRAMSKNRPPFSVELDLGALLRPRELEAVAFDSAGREIARDRITVNSGPHRFSVRLIEPRPGAVSGATTTVHAAVHSPLGEELDYVDFYWNESLVARLHQAPFVHTFDTPPGRGSSYLRAVAVLEDGHSADDLVVVDTGSTTEAIEVDFVELYVTVSDKDGAPVDDLSSDAFRVFEDGIEQEVRRFESPKTLAGGDDRSSAMSLERRPLNAAVVLDTSTSMEEEIEDVEVAAARFFEGVLESKDRAAVVVFSDGPELRVALTNDAEKLERGLSGIEAAGETSLYDSLIYGLYYLTGLRGKSALILVSDGADSISKFDLEDALDYARRAGIAVYAIGLGLSGRDVEEQAVLRRLAKETGGASFILSNTKRLAKVYAQIATELRSQYLLGYQSSQSDPDTYREVEVKLADPSLRVKSASGYYP